MRTNHFFKAIVIIVCLLSFNSVFSQYNEYTQRFLDLREKIYDPNNGYFSPDGVPYHSVETLICEAPDYGHETTSEAYSYWIWLDAMYGGVTGDWSPLNNAWSVMEAKAIPTADLQPTAGGYNPSSPATFAAEHPLPSDYPSPLESDVPVGTDPVSPDLTATYGSNIYGMHWLFDCDNFYGYGNKGDGVSTPSYINTFQRGEQESVWETVPHPSWENFSWGSDDGTGFLKLFIDEGGNAPAEQWRYTNAPDADARAVQAMYWASEFAREQGLNPASTLPMAKASEMGDFIRLAMFDKYFKPIGVQDKYAAGGTGYESAHYLISWYYAWGGPLVEQGWAWRIGCSHNHFGYQNPVAAYALSQYDDLKPISQNGVRDWTTSLDRQLEFYTWLQSAEGAIAGGATNSLNGDYDPYPAGTATFYGMVYQEHPVYHDPGSNQWFGMQAWSMERIAELYYISGDSRAQNLMDNWVAWVKSEVQLNSDGTFAIPSTLQWSGQPETWNPDAPAVNSNLHVSVSDYGTDLGITACLAKALTYYAAATQKYGTLDTDARDIAQELLDRMWNLYYEPNGAGVAVEETRADFSRFFEQEVYVPDGWTGKMANGDVIEPGISFIDIRSNYRNDPDFPALEAAYNSGQDYTKKYHRFWAQVDIALANAEFGRLFGTPVDTIDPTSVSVSPVTVSIEEGSTTQLTATVLPANATNKSVTWSSSNTDVATVNSSGVVTAVAEGSAIITVTTVVGGFSDECDVTVTPTTGTNYTVSVSIVGSGNVLVSPSGTSYPAGTEITFTAVPATGNYFVEWGGSLTGSQSPITVTINSDMDVTATFSGSQTGCDSYTPASMPLSQDGAGEYCWVFTGTISNINSWNCDEIIVNGTDYTNTYASNIPSQSGNYYVHYSASVPWAHFEINGTDEPTDNYTLTVNQPTGGSISPQTGTYPAGTVVNLTATADPGYEFANWTGDASGTSVTTSVVMDGDKSVSAVFNVVSDIVYTLDVTTTTGGTVTPDGGEYVEGTVVTLTATPAAGYQFVGWSGDASGTSLTTTVTMDANKSVTATFAEVIPDEYTLTVNVVGNGSVDPNGGTYVSGTQITLTATPDADNQFVGWSGDASGTSSSVTVTMDANKSVTATFEPVTDGDYCHGSSPVTTSLPFSQNGAGEYCWFTADGINYVNSWNMAVVEINGVDYTNTWSNSMPATVDGGYYIYYQGNYGWSHLEVAGPKTADALGTTGEIKIYPNPFNDAATLVIDNPESVLNVSVIDHVGRLVYTMDKTQISSTVEIGAELDPGVYYIKVKSDSAEQIIMISKQ